jgi:hypothetical protein
VPIEYRASRLPALYLRAPKRQLTIRGTFPSLEEALEHLSFSGGQANLNQENQISPDPLSEARAPPDYSAAPVAISRTSIKTSAKLELSAPRTRVA